MRNTDNEFDIECLDDLLNIEEIFAQDNKELYYFRGQENKEWNLIPKVLRSSEFKEPKLDVNSREDLFVEIARCQHYGIPTRFLDFTKDFYISLYFACENVLRNGDCNDGCVYAVYYDARNETYIDVNLICAMTQIEKNISIQELADLFCCEKYDEEDIVCRLASFLEYGFIVEPTQLCYEAIKESNPRMYAQKGCFYIPGNKTDRPLSEGFNRTSNYARYLKILPEIADVNPYLNDTKFNYRIIIPHNLKREILDYIDQKFNINKHTLCLD